MAIIWKIIRVILIFLYAFFLLWLIPTFFYHYSDLSWMKKIAEKVQLREMEWRNIPQQKEEGSP